VIVAAGTTLVDSGVIDRLVAEYERVNPTVELSVVGESTARVLDLGSRGAADLLITHAPHLEAEFLTGGKAAGYEPFLVSRFVLVGPGDSRVDGTPISIDEALRRIAGRNETFVSRADGSGTHEKELELWSRAGVDPAGASWYVETGQGMGLTLQVADQRGAYALAEYGVFLAADPALSLELVPLDKDSVLLNPYSLILVAGTEAEALAAEFAIWLRSDAGRRAVLDANHALFGELVYEPADR
jgi:tungstate transport system substrate-binding protein